MPAGSPDHVVLGQGDIDDRAQRFGVTDRRDATVGLGNPTLYFRFTGRFFFFTCARRLILRSFAYAKVISFMQNLGCFYRIPGAKSWTNGQIVDKEVVAKVV